MITFQVINKTSSSILETDEIIALGFMNHSDTPEILNYLELGFSELTAGEQVIANDFIDMIRTKVLAAHESYDGSDGSTS